MEIPNMELKLCNCCLPNPFTAIWKRPCSGFPEMAEVKGPC